MKRFVVATVSKGGSQEMTTQPRSSRAVSTNFSFHCFHHYRRRCRHLALHESALIRKQSRRRIHLPDPPPSQSPARSQQEPHPSPYHQHHHHDHHAAAMATPSVDPADVAIASEKRSHTETTTDVSDESARVTEEEIGEAGAIVVRRTEAIE